MTSPPAYRLPAGRQGRQATPPAGWKGLINLPTLSWERGIRGGEAKKED